MTGIARKIALRKYRMSTKNTETQRRYRATAHGKAATRLKEDRYAARNREKRNAKMAVAHAVRSGKLPPIKTQQCCNCQKPADHYNHDSYERDRRLDVRPMCKACHYRHHHETETTSLDDLGAQRGWLQRKVVSSVAVPDRFGREGYTGIIVLVLECGHRKSIRGSCMVPNTARCKPCATANQIAPHRPEAGI